MSTIDGLTKRQQQYLHSALKAKREEPERVQAVQAAAKAKVAAAIKAGVPVRVLADALGVTRARVYQIRDEALVASEPQSD